jgi:hypothetical protein
MAQRSTPRSAFQKAFLSALAGPTVLYRDRPPYEVYISKMSVADTFAKVGLSVTTAMGLERHDRGATPEAGRPNAP